MRQGHVHLSSRISGVLAIHRFSHHSGRGETIGGLSTAKCYVFSTRVCLDMSQEAPIHNIIKSLAQKWVWGRGCDGVQSGWSDVVVFEIAMVVI